MANSQKHVVDLVTGNLEPKFTDNGRERMDPNPIAAPLRLKREPSYFESIRNAVKRELSEAADSVGMETFEEANDFAIGEDFEPYSPYEEQFGPDGRNQWQIAQDHLKPKGGPATPEEGELPPAKPSAKQKTDPDLDPLD